MSFELPNFTQVPNALFDEHMAEMSLAEIKCILAIIRKTKGWHKDADTISLSQLKKMTGLANASVVKGLQDLLAKGLIGRTEKGQTFEYSLALKTSSNSEQVTSSKNEQVIESTSSKNEQLTSSKNEQVLVQKMNTQKKGLNKDLNKEAKLSLAEDVKIFQNIHPIASVKCIEELESAGTTAKWAIDTWGVEGLQGLLGEAHKINFGNRLGFIWADFILSRGRVSESVKPINTPTDEHETESFADWLYGKN